MALNVNEPTDQRHVNELPKYIREGRIAINSATSLGNVGYTSIIIAAGITSLSVGTDLGAYGFEIVKVTGAGVADLLTILGGSAGMIKQFIFQDTNIDLWDNISKADGTFYLNQLPVSGEFAPDQDDTITFVNIDGDGAAVYGYWLEIARQISVR